MAIDLYQTGVSGLMAAQSQLAVTGHNIANVNTEGYNRQRAEQMTTVGLTQGGLHYGSGTKIADVTRVYQEYAFRDLLINSTEKAGAQALYDQLAYLDSGVSSMGAAIGKSLNELYNSIDALTDNPADLGNRSLMLANAEDLAKRFNDMHANLSQQMSISSQDIATRTERVTELSAGIAALNQEILNTGQNGAPNDLLDRRDLLIKELSQEVRITTLNEPNGVVSVMLDGRESLVSGTQAFALEARPGNPDPQQTELYLSNPAKAGSATRLEGATLGGKLGATVQFRDQVLAPAMSDLGRTALGLADAFNQVQRQGMDLNGLPGLDLFRDINAPEAQAGRFLTDNPAVSGAVAITDTGALSGNDYRLEYKNGDYLITNLGSGESTQLTPDAEGRLNHDGFSLTLAGTPANGDRMLLRPSRDGAADLRVSLQSPEQIAASGQVLVTPNGDNTGSARLSTKVSDPNGADLPGKGDPLVVTLNGQGEYQVFRQSDPDTPLAGGTLDSDNPVIALDGIRISVAGQGGSPLDRFEIEAAGGAGNNVNAQAFGDIKNKKWLNNGKTGLEGGLNQLMVGVGGKTYNQKIKAETAAAAHTQSQNRLLSASGVNLDEEAANLLRFQQAYMASSRVVTVANDIFNSLLQIR